MNAEQVEYLYLDVVAVRRQEVDAALLAHSIVADGLEALHGRSILHADALSHIVHTVNTAIPHNVFYVDVVANKRLDVVVDVDDTYKSVTVKSEIIQERRVLTERIIAIGWEITRRLVIAKQYYNATLYKLLKLGAAVHVGCLVKHNYTIRLQI